MKVVLTGGKEWDVSLVNMETETQLRICFMNITSYDSLRRSLNIDSLKSIRYFSDSGSDVYEGFTRFVKSSATETTDGKMEVLVYLSLETDQEQRTAKLEQKSDTKDETLDTILTVILPAIESMIG